MPKQRRPTSVSQYLDTPHAIALDTQALVESGWPFGPNTDVVCELAASLGVEIWLPQAVLLERTSQVAREARDQGHQLEKSARFLRLAYTVSETNYSTHLADWEASCQGWLKRQHVRELPLPDRPLADELRLRCPTSPPFDSKWPKDLKDSAIWRSILDTVQASESLRVWLISADGGFPDHPQLECLDLTTAIRELNRLIASRSPADAEALQQRKSAAAQVLTKAKVDLLRRVSEGFDVVKEALIGPSLRVLSVEVVDAELRGDTLALLPSVKDVAPGQRLRGSIQVRARGFLESSHAMEVAEPVGAHRLPVYITSTMANASAMDALFGRPRFKWGATLVVSFQLDRTDDGYANPTFGDLRVEEVLPLGQARFPD